MTTSTPTNPAPADPTLRPSTRPRTPRRRVGTAVVAVTGLAFTALMLILITVGITVGRDGDVETIRPTDVTRVDVDIDAGVVTAVAADELQIDVERRSGPFARTPSGTAHVTDGVLRVTGSCSWVGLGRCRTDVTVALPPGVAISVATEAGAIDVSGATAGADLRTVGGAIRVRDAEGGVRLRSDAGLIDGAVSRGAVEASTSAGSITLTVTEEVSRISASTEVGPVELVVPDAVYDVDAHTSIGRTRVEVRTDPASDRVIRARSEVGTVTVRTPAGRDPSA